MASPLLLSADFTPLRYRKASPRGESREILDGTDWHIACVRRTATIHPTKKANSMHRAVLAAAVLSLTTATAWADPVTYDFSATLAPNIGDSAGPFNAGDAVTGSFTYDTGAAANFNTDTFSDYVLESGSITDMTQSFTLSLPGNANNVNDVSVYTAGDDDQVGFTAYTADYDGFGDGIRVELTLVAPSGTLTDTSLPGGLTEFSPMQGDVYQSEFSGDVNLSFAAPEPASASLLGAALAGLALRRRRRVR